MLLIYIGSCALFSYNAYTSYEENNSKAFYGWTVAAILSLANVIGEIVTL